MSDEDQLDFSLDLDDLHKPKDQEKDPTRIIEQLFPDASILGPQFLVPHLFDHRKRFFFELDFAKEENVEDYTKQLDQGEKRHVRRQTKTYRHTVDGESIISEMESEEASIQKSISKIKDKEELIDEKYPLEEVSMEKTLVRNEEIIFIIIKRCYPNGRRD